MLSIRSVKVLGDLRVRLRLSDGAVVERGLQRVSRRGVFEPPRKDYALFRQVKVMGGTLTWPGYVDLAPETVIWRRGATRRSDCAPTVARRAGPHDRS